MNNNIVLIHKGGKLLKIYITDNMEMFNILTRILKCSNVQSNLGIVNDQTLIINIDLKYTLNIEGLGTTIQRVKLGDTSYTLAAQISSTKTVEKLQKALNSVNKKDVLIVNCFTCNASGDVRYILLDKLINISSITRRAWFNNMQPKTINDNIYNLQSNTCMRGFYYLIEYFIGQYLTHRYKGFFLPFNINLTSICTLLYLSTSQESQTALGSQTEPEQKYKIKISSLSEIENPRKIDSILHDRKEKELVYDEETAHDICSDLQGKKVTLLNLEEQIKPTTQPPLLFNTYDLLSLLRNKRNFAQYDVNAGLNKLYKLGYITNPNTSSRFFNNPNQAKEYIISLLKALSNIKDYGPYLNYIKSIIGDIKINNRYIDSSFNTLPILPTEKVLTVDINLEEELVQIYNIVMKSTLSMIMGPEISLVQKWKGHIGKNYKVIGNRKICTRQGFKILNSEKDEVQIVIKHEMNTNFLSLYTLENSKSMVVYDGQPTMLRSASELVGAKNLVTALNYYGERKITSTIKRKKIMGIGNAVKTMETLNELIDNNLVIVTDNKKLMLSGYALTTLEEHNLSSIKLNELFRLFNKLNYIMHTNESFSRNYTIAKDVLEVFYKLIDATTIKETQDSNIDYDELCQSLLCPICDGHLYNHLDHISCLQCHLKIYKSMHGVVLSKHNLTQLCTNGVTGFIQGFQFKNTLNGRARLKVNKSDRKIGLSFK